MVSMKVRTDVADRSEETMMDASWQKYIKEARELSCTSDDLPPPSPSTRQALVQYFGTEDFADIDGALSTKSAPISSEDTVPVAADTGNCIEEELIWGMTHEYFQRLQSLCSQSSSSELSHRLLQRFTRPDPDVISRLSFILRAIDIVKTNSEISKRLRNSQRKPQKKRHLTVGRQLEGEIETRIAQEKTKFREKSGRRPEKFCCYLCDSVFPYKKLLISHIQQDHGISRCQSLLYKRLNQGAAQFKRLYAAEK